MSDIKRINVNNTKATINPDYDAKLNHTDASLFTADALKHIAGYNPANGINMQNAVDVLAKKHTSLESKAAYVMHSFNDSDLDIGDSEGNVLARFSDGHFQTMNFDSSVITNRVDLLDTHYITDVDSSLFSLDISDEAGNVLARFSDGHIKTKNFDSNKDFIYTEEQQIDSSLTSLDISDEDGNVLARFSNGHIQTKFFDSSVILTEIDSKEGDVTVKLDNSQSNLNIGDNNGYVIAQFKDGHIKTKNFDSRDVNNNNTLEVDIKIQDFTTYLGDVVLIFKYPVTFIPNYRDYSVNIFMNSTNNNIKKQCRCLERFAEVTPTATGVYPMGIKVFTHDGYLLAEKSFNMTVIAKPLNPQNVINVLCIGDSITLGTTNNSGITVELGASEQADHPWTTEIKDYLGNRAVTTTAPAGLNLSNIHLIGTRNTTVGRNEGYGGWNATKFMSSQSPFYINGRIDFNAYLALDKVYDDVSHKGVDIIYIMLGANGGASKSIIDGKIVINPAEHSRTLKIFLNKIKEQIIEGTGEYANPNCKIILLSYLAQWTSGYGYHPYGSGEWTDGTLTARGLMACYEENVKIAAMDEYSSFCSTSMIAPFVDSENSFAYINKQINKRMSETYKALIEQVHPNSLGYTMMGEAVVRDLISRI